MSCVKACGKYNPMREGAWKSYGGALSARNASFGLFTVLEGTCGLMVGEGNI